jgi:hypothetical protein
MYGHTDVVGYLESIEYLVSIVVYLQYLRYLNSRGTEAGSEAGLSIRARARLELSYGRYIQRGLNVWYGF